jgi:predicted transcriptional regulator of viral defense system
MLRDDVIHITIPGCPADPRAVLPDLPGVKVHYVPKLHPDDVTVIDGIPCTSLSRTLIDCAEDATADELRAMFTRAHEMGVLDLCALEASLGRVEWRPSRYLVRALMREFEDRG